MDVSTEQDDEVWINKALGVPAVPETRRDHYPFSRCTALTYRLKLSVLLLIAGYAFIGVEHPCLRLSLLLNSWLLGLTCEAVYRNYPWREPLTAWLWWFRLSAPHSALLPTSCATLLLLLWAWSRAGCQLPHPFAAASVGWLCCAVAWPLVRERWRRVERTLDDYHQFSDIRPSVLTFSRPLCLLLVALRSPSLNVLVAASVFVSFGALLLPGWLSGAWLWCATTLLLGCLATLICHRLPRGLQATHETWDREEADYMRKIEKEHRALMLSLVIAHHFPESSDPFDQLSVRVPLLQRELDILLNSGQSKVRELSGHRDLEVFRKRLDQYGPYTTGCCVS